jgi:hypothetical protein
MSLMTIERLINSGGKIHTIEYNTLDSMRNVTNHRMYIRRYDISYMASKCLHDVLTKIMV